MKPLTNTPIDSPGPLGEAGARLRALVANLLEWADEIESCAEGAHAGINATIQEMRAKADELEALLSAPVVSGWQPIDKHTKHESGEIVLWGFAYGSWRPVVAHYMENAPEDHPPIDSGWYHWQPGMSWSNGAQKFIECGSFVPVAKATHWQRLAAPVVTQEGEEPCP